MLPMDGEEKREWSGRKMNLFRFGKQKDGFSPENEKDNSD